MKSDYNFKFIKNDMYDYKCTYLCYYCASKQLINMIKVSKNHCDF